MCACMRLRRNARLLHLRDPVRQLLAQLQLGVVQGQRQGVLRPRFHGTSQTHSQKAKEEASSGLFMQYLDSACSDLL